MKVLLSIRWTCIGFLESRCAPRHEKGGLIGCDQVLSVFARGQKNVLRGTASGNRQFRF
jgi:hypothetical protein